MRSLSKLITLILLLSSTGDLSAQDQQTRIDSLVNLLSSAGREWNDYARPLIEIGEPAVRPLIRLVEDNSLEQWNRRIAVMTLNEIHSVLWKDPALKILFDHREDPVLRNQVTGGLWGFNLSEQSEDLWQLFGEESNEFHRSNLASLLVNADTALAYRAYYELYQLYDGHIQKSALLHLISLRPDETTIWLLDAIQLDDWMTSNMAMDSLIGSKYFQADPLINLYKEASTREEVRWRIVFIFGHRDEPESIPLLMEAFQEESWLVHTEAAVGLSGFEPDRVLPEMRSFRKNTRPFIRHNARWVIDIMNH